MGYDVDRKFLQAPASVNWPSANGAPMAVRLACWGPAWC